MFDISVEQSVLAKALEFLEPTVGKNTNQLGDNCLSMTATGNGSIAMYTTNTVEFTSMEVIVIMGNNCSNGDRAPYIDFKRFKSIISSIPANEMVSIKATVNDLEISYALKKPTTLVGCINGMLPLPNNSFPQSSMISIPKNTLVTALTHATSIITDSDSAPIYNCIRIFANAQGIEFTAVDTLAKRTFASTAVATQNNPQTEILLEASKARKSLKIFEDYNDLDMYMDQTMVRIDGASVSTHTPKTKGMISSVSYFTRRLSGAFPPNIKQNFSPMPAEYCEINKEELLSSFARVKALEDSNTGGQIGFEVNGSNCVITMNSAYGNVEDSITMENVSQKSFKTMFKHQNISDIIKMIPTDTFEIGALPNHPTNYVIKAKGNTNILFTVPTMVGGNNP